jgi:hypothetical protein
MTPNILACVYELQLLGEVTLGEDCSTVSRVTMLQNFEGTVIGKSLGNKYFQLHKNGMYSSFPKINIFSAALLCSIHTAHISTELHIIMFQPVDRYHKDWLNQQLLKYSHYPIYVRVAFRGAYSNLILRKSEFPKISLIRFYLTRRKK